MVSHCNHLWLLQRNQVEILVIVLTLLSASEASCRAWRIAALGDLLSDIVESGDIQTVAVVACVFSEAVTTAVGNDTVLRWIAGYVGVDLHTIM